MLLLLEFVDFDFQPGSLCFGCGGKPDYENQPDKRHEQDDRGQSPRENSIAERPGSQIKTIIHRKKSSLRAYRQANFGEAYNPEETIANPMAYTPDEETGFGNNLK